MTTTIQNGASVRGGRSYLSSLDVFDQVALERVEQRMVRLYRDASTFGLLLAKP
jgi:hypothetical protein